MSVLATYLLYFKALHVVFVVTWFAGLFYLPRLFVYHAVTTDLISTERFTVMERRLYAIMSIGAVLAGVFGVLMVAAVPGYLQMGWLHAKLGLVAVLVGYHFWCGHLVKVFAQHRNTHSQRWYRWFNEAPSMLLIAIVILAVVKPF
jgi:putative membrane protein